MELSVIYQITIIKSQTNLTMEKAKIIKNGNVNLQNIVVETPSKCLLTYVKLLGCNTITVDKNTLKTAKKLALHDIEERIKLTNKFNKVCIDRGFVFLAFEAELKMLKEMEKGIKIL